MLNCLITKCLLICFRNLMCHRKEFGKFCLKSKEYITISFSLILLIERLIFVKMSGLSKYLYWFNAMPIKIQDNSIWRLIFFIFQQIVLKWLNKLKEKKTQQSNNKKTLWSFSHTTYNISSKWVRVISMS